MGSASVSNHPCAAGWGSLWERCCCFQGPGCVCCAALPKCLCCTSSRGLSIFPGVELGKVYGPRTSTITSTATVQTKNYDSEVCKKPVTWYTFSWFVTKLLLQLCPYRRYWSPILMEACSKIGTPQHRAIIQAPNHSHWRCLSLSHAPNSTILIPKQLHYFKKEHGLQQHRWAVYW